MKKQSHQILIDYFKEVIPRYKKEVFERQRQTDNVVIWITGLSTGAIVLIFSQADNISFISLVGLKYTVFFLLCTIVAGVIFRAYIYNLEQVESEIIMGFEGYCYGASWEIHGPIEITETHTIQQIAESLKKDMGLNYDDWLKRDNLDRSFWVDHYNKWADFWRRSEEEGLRSLGKAFAPLLSKKPEETEEFFLKKHDDKETAQRAITLRMICNKAYLYMLIFFGLAILTISISFVFS